MPFNLGFAELILILIVIVIILGPGKLPKVGKALGDTVRAYRKESTKGLPPPEKSRWEKASERRRENSAPRGVAGGTQARSTEAVADPGKRRALFGGMRLFQWLVKLWRWRRGRF